MQTVVETPSYLNESGGEAFQPSGAQSNSCGSFGGPECGDLIPGTRGFRKVRIGRDHMGTRGGARVVYILRNDKFPIFLIASYGKNEKENLSKAERNELAKMSDTIFEKYGR